MELVESFVERALYGPRGFYETGGRAGRRTGSFVTGPEVGPLFGAVIARAIDRWWTESGEPPEWVVVDAGAGPGTLARTVLAAGPVCAPALRFVCVERTAAQRGLHPRDLGGVESRRDLPQVADVILANELLDNLPFGMLEHTSDGWFPVSVADGRTVPDTGGARIPVASAAAAWVTDATVRLRPGGRLICFDYANTTPAMAARPWTDWVRGFADQEQVEHPFAEPGTCDVTVVVPWDQLPAPDRWSSQAEWLRRNGIEELLEEGRAHWRAHAAAPDLSAIRMRSRLTEAEALLDPAGMGGFWVGEWERRSAGASVGTVVQS